MKKGREETGKEGKGRDGKGKEGKGTFYCTVGNTGARKRKQTYLALKNNTYKTRLISLFLYYNGTKLSLDCDGTNPLILLLWRH